MTVIKFTNGNSNTVVRPGINGSKGRVFDAILKYSTKDNLPKSAGREELIFTTDTHEFFRGNGGDSSLVPFNTVLMYESFSKFPSKGIESKIYVDKSSSLMFIWAEQQYKAIGGSGGGEIIIAPNDGQIGDLNNLSTMNKENLVLAINEVFDSLILIDADTIKGDINTIETTVNKINNAIGSVSNLTTANKTTIVSAINEIVNTINTLSASGGVTPDQLLALENKLLKDLGKLSSLTTNKKDSLVSAINELVVRISGVENIGQELSNLRNQVNAQGSSISNLTSRVTTLENQSIPQMQGKITTLENEVAALKVMINGILNPVPKPGDIIWEQEFVLETGESDYDLLSDPSYAGKSIEESDLMEEPLALKLYSLGNAKNTPTEPQEIPHIGDAVTSPPTVHGRWDTIALGGIRLESAGMTSWRFKLVKYVK